MFFNKKKDKKGQVGGFFFLFMIFTIMFILGFALASPLITNSNSARATMDCSNSSISTDQKINCGIVDIAAPFIIALIFGLGASALGAKLIGI